MPTVHLVRGLMAEPRRCWLADEPRRHDLVLPPSTYAMDSGQTSDRKARGPNLSEGV